MLRFRLVFVSLIISLALICPQLTQAATAKTLPPGTLFKFQGTGTVYFVASDAKAYTFPDEATFYSWFPSFSKVKVMDRKDVANTTVKTIISVKPGARIVKFGTDPKLYAVSRGARLRWIQTEQLLSDLFSSDWRNYFITLPASRLSDYAIGEAISKASSYHRNDERLNVTISQELYARGFVRKDNVAPGGASLPLIKSLTENLKDSLKPSFNPQTTYYSINAQYNEDKITLVPKAYEDYMTISVGDYAVADSSGITLDIPAGKTDFPIKVSSPDGTSVIYTLHIVRGEGSDNHLLSSLSENLIDTMWPSFQSHFYDYTVYAKEAETSITVRAQAADTTSYITIDGNRIGASGSFQRNLHTGDNVMKIVVTSQNGYTQTYTLTVKKVV